MTEFQKALQIDPRSFDAHLGLGRVYVALRDFAKAGKAGFRRALDYSGRTGVAIANWVCCTITSPITGRRLSSSST